MAVELRISQVAERASSNQQKRTRQPGRCSRQAGLCQLVRLQGAAGAAGNGEADAARPPRSGPHRQRARACGVARCESAVLGRCREAAGVRDSGPWDLRGNAWNAWSELRVRRLVCCGKGGRAGSPGTAAAGDEVKCLGSRIGARKRRGARGCARSGGLRSRAGLCAAGGMERLHGCPGRGWPGQLRPLGGGSARSGVERSRPKSRRWHEYVRCRRG